MNLTTLRDHVNFILDNNDLQADASFSTARMNDAINWAYQEEMSDAQLEGGMAWFFTTTDVAWPAEQVTLPLPAGIQQENIIEVHNVTDNDPGKPVVIGGPGTSARLHWKDRLTLQWGEDGPTTAQTLRFFYYAVPSTLVEDEDLPELMPPQFHKLIALSAVVFLMEIADREAPALILRRQRKLQAMLQKYVSRPRPLAATNMIASGRGDSLYLNDPDVDSGASGGLDDVD